MKLLKFLHYFIFYRIQMFMELNIKSNENVEYFRCAEHGAFVGLFISSP